MRDKQFVTRIVCVVNIADPDIEKKPQVNRNLTLAEATGMLPLSNKKVGQAK